MNIHEKILVLENYVIDWLTVITWWIETRFDKDNVDVAISAHKVECLLWICICLEMSHFFFKNGLHVFLCVTVFYGAFETIRLLSLIFLEFIARTKFTTQFPQGCPNPCRILAVGIGARRVSTVVMVVTTWLLGIFFSTDSYSFMFASCIAVGSLLNCIFYFLLSCDSLPPEEKAARRLKNEMGTRQMILSV